MADKKKRAASKQNAKTKKKAQDKKTNEKQNKKRDDEEQDELQFKPIKEYNPESAIHQILPTLFVVCAIFVSICYLFNGSMGIVGEWIYKLSFGGFGLAAWGIPVILISRAVTWREGARTYSTLPLTLCAIFFVVAAATLAHGITAEGNNAFSNGLAQGFADLWANSTDGSFFPISGGVIGGTLGTLMLVSFSYLGTLIICIPLSLILLMFAFDLTPKKIWLYFRYKAKLRREKKAAIEEAREKAELEYEQEMAEDEIQDEIPYRHHEPVSDDYDDGYESDYADVPPEQPQRKFDVDIPLDDDSDPVDLDVFVRVESEELAASARASSLENADRGKKLSQSQMEKYFGEGEYDGAPDDEDTLEISKQSVGEKKPKKEPVIQPEPPAPAYIFPPIELLKKPERLKETDIEEEISTNAAKLVKTLESFRVMTHVVSTSHGPTITRYELAPEPGVRVRAVANLVDDISLSLATTGVRIEAPIPGKAAIGIEVPNKVVATVNVRELIETEAFRASPSKLNVALGKDVAGAPVFCDIDKMPHMLIAGATGMGKSVCINSIIISLLYKATPDEVKLILIDPKKVEFNIYKDIPHLLVPVVSDPKKAAGSLQWAVTEMERRFELIESVGMRNIKGYNSEIKEINDGVKREPLPQIVIIIDELADLMMTAPDAVEEAICRLAQKARAAGMHLIIGTQRPSVDVITGLIKANVPSRIAFTVASQVDSRTIIDIGGAEKLIGRGDMLYAPVGSAKPRRVQGSFVSDKEVEAVAEFIKSHFGVSDYDDSVVESIEKAAARCGQKKGVVDDGADDGDAPSDDPKFREAVELALSEQKISTSLIQRRLGLGYGRAAKLIDIMERRGIVSAPDGQKPRQVLITKQDYMEMVVNDDDKLS